MVNDIVVEVGNPLYQGIIDRFVSGHPVANTELRQVWRNLIGSPLDVPNAPVSEQFYRTVRAINQTLPTARRLRVLLTDAPGDWRTIHDAARAMRLGATKEPFMGDVLERHVLRRGHRALLIAGSVHVDHAAERRRTVANAVQLIERRHSGGVFTVAVHEGFGRRTAELELRLGRPLDTKRLFAEPSLRYFAS